MDAQTSLKDPPSRSVTSHLRGAMSACLGAWRHAARLALDIALPTLCVACREPVDGEGVCASCWAKLSFIEPPYCPRLGIPFVYDPAGARPACWWRPCASNPASDPMHAIAAPA